MGLKVVALIVGVVRPSRTRGVAFLTYHRVIGNLGMELDLPWALFRKQLQYLRRHFNIISYDRALGLLEANVALDDKECVLTFDDGYQDFYTHVFPLLKEMGVPATLFVSTAFVEEGIAYPIVNFRPLRLSVQPVTWEMLAEMHASGLVTIGAHTHTHPDLPTIGDTEIIDELERSNEIFCRRLGFTPIHFAYPRAKWNVRAEEIIKRYYSTAAIVGGVKVNQRCWNRYRITRLPMRRSDGWWFFKLRLRGLLEYEERMYGLVRQILRRS